MGYSIEAEETYPDYYLDRKLEYVNGELVDNGYADGPVQFSAEEVKFYEDMQAMAGYWHWLAIFRKHAAGLDTYKDNPFRTAEEEERLDNQHFSEMVSKLVDRGIPVPAPSHNPSAK